MTWQRTALHSQGLPGCRLALQWRPFPSKQAPIFSPDSVGLLSDALELLVNLAGAIMALIMLTIAARPPDESHVYGHSKAEYFASATGGLLILGAAIGIISAAINRLLQPRRDRSS